MPGIAGIISPSLGTSHREQLRQMAERLCYEPGAVSQHIEHAEVGVQAAWVRRDDQLRGPEFAWNPEQKVGLIFFGEEFTNTIPAEGSDGAQSSSPAARLLARYLAQGSQFFTALNGQFCGIVIDLRDHAVVVFNDRYGLGRIYYHQSGDRFYFASEAKALLAALPQLRTLNQAGLAEYVAVGCVLQNRTVFSNVHLLPPGSAWTFRADGTVSKHRYFDPAAWEEQSELSVDEFGEALRDVFSRTIKRYIAGSAPVGLSLTGGLDSRALIAWIPPEAGPLPCYTFAGPYRDCADVKIARNLAKACHLHHTTIPFADDFFPNFDQLAEKSVFISDGTMDVSGAVELHMNRFASQIAPIRLTGNYGSEILRSNVAFRPSHIQWQLYTPEFCRLLEQAVGTYEQEARGHRLSFIAFKQMPWHHYARLSIERAELTPRSPFLDNELVALAYRTPAHLRTSAQPMLDLIASGNAPLARMRTDRALRVGGSPLLNAAAHEWQEFTAKAEYAYDYGMPQWLARADRTVSKLHLERLFLGRHKFYHFRIWYRDQLSRFVRDRLQGASAKPSCFRKGVIEDIAEAHTSGRGNYTLALHKALTLTSIERLFCTA